MAFRHIRSTFKRDGATRTPTGGLRIPATPTRTGVLVYTNPDGSMRREYRPPTEVFAEDSLASLDSAAITIGHPAEPVDAKSWRKLSVGHSSRGVKVGDSWVGTAVDVLEDEAIRRVLAGELVELSCGYVCDVDTTPGTSPEGEEYDAVQKNIRYNHIALLEQGWARAGRGARLHLDSACANLSQPVPTDGTTPEDTPMTELEKAQARALAAEDALKEAQSKLDALGGELTATKALLEKARNDASPEALAAAVRVRVALENDVRAVKGVDFKVDGLSDRDLLVAVAGDLAPKDASIDFLKGVCAPLVAQAKKADSATKTALEVAAALPTSASTKSDAADEDPRAVYNRNNEAQYRSGLKRKGE